MDKENFSRILNFNKQVHTTFREEWDLHSINQFIAGIESCGYKKVGGVQRIIRITSICEGGAMEMIWTCDGSMFQQSSYHSEPKIYFRNGSDKVPYPRGESL
jgi:hypothetical protein